MPWTLLFESVTWVTLTVSEVVDTENCVQSALSMLLGPNSLAEIQAADWQPIIICIIILGLTVIIGMFISDWVHGDSQCSSSGTYFEQWKGVTLPSNSSFLQTSSTNQLSCGGDCITHSRCVGFLYHPSNNSCELLDPGLINYDLLRSNRGSNDVYMRKDLISHRLATSEYSGARGSDWRNSSSIECNLSTSTIYHTVFIHFYLAST